MYNLFSFFIIFIICNRIMQIWYISCFLFIQSKMYLYTNSFENLSKMIFYEETAIERYRLLPRISDISYSFVTHSLMWKPKMEELCEKRLNTWNNLIAVK